MEKTNIKKDTEAKASPKILREFYFWTGILATLLYRAIIVVNYYSSFWVKIFWYVGTIGFVIYFAHRYQISQKRNKLVKEHDLINKVGLLNVSDEDRSVMAYIFSTLSSSKEKWNYIAIFILSGIALILGIIFDFVI